MIEYIGEKEKCEVGWRNGREWRGKWKFGRLKMGRRSVSSFGFEGLKSRMSLSGSKLIILQHAYTCTVPTFRRCRHVRCMSNTDAEFLDLFLPVHYSLLPLDLRHMVVL